MVRRVRLLAQHQDALFAPAPTQGPRKLRGGQAAANDDDPFFTHA